MRKVPFLKGAQTCMCADVCYIKPAAALFQSRMSGVFSGLPAFQMLALAPPHPATGMCP